MISAFSINPIPQLTDYLPSDDGDISDLDQLVDDLGAGRYTLDPEHVSQDQMRASLVSELSDLVGLYGVPDIPILFCDMPGGELGSASNDEDVPGPLVLINPGLVSGSDALRGLYLHEVAHLLTNSDEIHGMHFVALLNFLRSRCGLRLSEDDYDYRDCMGSDHIDQQRAQRLSCTLAEIASRAQWSVRDYSAYLHGALISGIDWERIPLVLEGCCKN